MYDTGCIKSASVHLSYDVCYHEIVNITINKNIDIL